VLGRRVIAWQFANGGLAIDGGPKLSLRGGAKLHGNELDWGGFHWHRARVRS
jgi:hypothetical protein